MQRKSHSIDADQTNFQTAVIEESNSRPVIVDLWATWCGPCKALGPVLEQCAADYDGAFLLAKVDVDKSPTLAQAFGAQSIPMVVALYQGRPVDQFVGALPAEEIKQFVNKVLSSCGVAIPGRDPMPESDNSAEMESYWQGRLKENSKDGEALLELGRLLLQNGRGEEAVEQLEKIRARMPQYDDALAALKLNDLMGEIRDAGGDEAIRARLRVDPTNVEATYLAACAAGVRGNYVRSLETIVSLISQGPPEIRGRARDAASVIFRAAGRGDDQVEELRRQLARLLF